MASRLPIPGQDDGIWGNVLNDFLSQTHSSDGTLNSDTVGTSQLQSGSVTPVKLSATGAASNFNFLRGDGTWAVPNGSGASIATSSSPGLIQLAGDISGTATAPTVPGLATKEPAVVVGTVSQYYRGDKTFQTLDKTAVGLANVDNTTDLNKPISTATQTALNTKASASGLAQVATSGSYVDLTSKPTIPVVTGTNTGDQTISITSNTLTISGSNGNSITLPASTTSDATSSAKGVIQLTGDLSGSAIAPTVAKINGISLPASAPVTGTVLTASSPTTTSWMVPSSSGSLSTASDASMSSIANGDVITYNATTSKWQNKSVSSLIKRYDVKAYGAIGDGSTDDSLAIMAARDAYVAAMSSTSAGSNMLSGELYFPAGVYKVTTAEALFTSPTTGTSQLLRNIRITGEGRRISEILFSSTATASNDPRANNLMLLANRVRGMTVTSLSFNSTNPAQSFCYMWCSSANDGTYPGYGSGSQNDFVWEDVELRGTWARGWGFDGDSSANQNSEQVWKRCAADNTTSFTDAVVKSGFAPFFPQQDQFVNYDFYYCHWEYADGDFFVANMGGFINVWGGSYINGIPTGSTGGTWFRMPQGPHFDDVKLLSVKGTRFEFRKNTCKLIDTGWANAAHISFDGITIASNTVSNPAEMEVARFTQVTGNGQPMIRFTNCELPGYMTVDLASNVAANTGCLVLDTCRFRQYAGNNTTISTAATAIRKTTGTPNVRFRSVWGTPDN